MNTAHVFHHPCQVWHIMLQQLFVCTALYNILTPSVADPGFS